MGTCKTCKYWDGGSCDFVDTIESAKPDKRFEIDAYAADDTGLTAILRTGPDFGCIHHKE